MNKIKILLIRPNVRVVGLTKHLPYASEYLTDIAFRIPFRLQLTDKSRVSFSQITDIHIINFNV